MCGSLRCGRDHISIHAPAKGATLSDIRQSQRRTYFNPRSREGSDWEQNGFRNAHGISIHAPAKGATTRFLWILMMEMYFNPRSREGSDEMVQIIVANSYNFNPRSREGSDLCASSLSAISIDFNPRSREGSDDVREV